MGVKPLDFFIVSNDYVTYLQQSELLERGFSRVPNMNYGKNRKPKFLCGVVMKVDNFNYFVPVSSYKKQMPDNFLICDRKGLVVSSLRFNYMFPVPLSMVKSRSIDEETDSKYRSLLSQELTYCNSHYDNIKQLAKRTYKRVNFGKNQGLVHNSCDFKLLEQKCMEYEQDRIIKQSKAVETTIVDRLDETLPMDLLIANASSEASKMNERTKENKKESISHNFTGRSNR